MYDAIVISDLHLGSEISQAKQLVRFLEMLREDIILTRELILNGDVFDSWDFRRLKKNHWKVLSIIRSLSDHVKIVWTSGNHDYPEDAATVAQLIGAEVCDRYLLESGGKKILIFHGHMFDRFISDHPIVTRLVDFLYGILAQDRQVVSLKPLGEAPQQGVLAMLGKDRACGDPARPQARLRHGDLRTHAPGARQHRQRCPVFQQWIVVRAAVRVSHDPRWSS